MLSKVAAERRAKLEIFPAHSVLRITADKTTAEYAADDIEQALVATCSKKLHLKPWTHLLTKEKVPDNGKLATLFTQEHFDMITSLTRATIQSMDNSNTVRSPKCRVLSYADFHSWSSEALPKMLLTRPRGSSLVFCHTILMLYLRSTPPAIMAHQSPRH